MYFKDPIPKQSIIKKFNWSLLVTTLTLIIIGLLNLYSVSHRPHSGADQLFYLQTIWLTMGVCVFFGFSFMHYHYLIKWAYIIYGFNVICLMAVYLWGQSYGGAKRWLDLIFFSYQPAETTKLVLVIVLARLLSIKRSWQVMTTELVKPVIFILVPVLLITRQPDLGTALIIMIITTSVIIFAKVHKYVLFSALALVVFVTPLAWKFGLKEYQKNRIITFISPGQDPRGTGYNTIQSKIAIGSGQFMGKGFQKGTQSQLEFLPERHTDFIFSVLSEEHGFIGSVVTILLFLLLIFIGFHSALQARDKEGVFLCVGMSFYLFWHIFINIAMTMGLLPVVGVPLPLLSYGGSSLITTMTALGVISSVSCRKYLF